MNENQQVVHNDIIYIEKAEKDYTFECAFQYNCKYSEKVLSFANNINTVNGGVHLNSFKTALLKTVVEFIDKNKLLHDFSANVLPRDISEGLIAVVNIKIKHPQFEGQTKTKLNNIELRTEIEETCKKELTTYFKKNQDECDKIITKIAETVRLRDAAAKARELEKKKSGRFEGLGLPLKLTDCVSKNREECELFIVEGDSASCVLGTTLIRTKNGLKQIKDIEIGDEVLTHTGQYKKVYDKFTTKKKKRALLQIKGHSYICSDDHKFYINSNGKLIFKELRNVNETDFFVSF